MGACIIERLFVLVKLWPASHHVYMDPMLLWLPLVDSFTLYLHFHSVPFSIFSTKSRVCLLLLLLVPMSKHKDLNSFTNQLDFFSLFYCQDFHLYSDPFCPVLLRPYLLILSLVFYTLCCVWYNTEMSFSFTPLPQILPYKYRQEHKTIGIYVVWKSKSLHQWGPLSHSVCFADQTNQR